MRTDWLCGTCNGDGSTAADGGYVVCCECAGSGVGRGYRPTNADRGLHLTSGPIVVRVTGAFAGSGLSLSCPLAITASDYGIARDLATVLTGCGLVVRLEEPPRER